MRESTNNSRGIGFVGMLTILFIGLKLCGIISWAWLWVFSPLWISALITVIVILAYTLYHLCRYP